MEGIGVKRVSEPGIVKYLEEKRMLVEILHRAQRRLEHALR